MLNKEIANFIDFASDEADTKPAMSSYVRE
jgi:hypothetical protein